MGNNNLNPYIFSSILNSATGSGGSAATAMTIKAANEKVGIKFWARSTSPITSFECVIITLGTGIDKVVRCGIFNDSSGSPGTQVGSYTADITIINVAGIKYLNGGDFSALTPNNTGNLTLNDPYWLVIEYVSGTWDASNSIQIIRLSPRSDREVIKHFASVWDDVTPVNLPAMAIFKHANNTVSNLSGLLTLLGTGSSIDGTIAPHIFKNTVPATDEYNVQFVKYSMGCKHLLKGIVFSLQVVTTPSALDIRVFTGATVGTQVGTTLSIAYEKVGDVIPMTIVFSDPITINADDVVRIVFSQEGTSGSADYNFRVYTVDADFITYLLPETIQFCYQGLPEVSLAFPVSPDFSGEQILTTEVFEKFSIIFMDLSNDFDCVASGGDINMPRVRIGH